MPYLKDCIVTEKKGAIAAIYKYALFEVYSKHHGFGRGGCGQTLKWFGLSDKGITYTGTPISDRDYLLSIARAKALQNNQK